MDRLRFRFSLQLRTCLYNRPDAELNPPCFQHPRLTMIDGRLGYLVFRVLRSGGPGRYMANSRSFPEP